MEDNRVTIYTNTGNAQEIADRINATWINTKARISRYSRQELLTAKLWGHVAWTLVMLDIIFDIIASDSFLWWYWIIAAVAAVVIALEAVGWWRTYQERRADK